MISFQTSYTKSLDKKIQNRKNLTLILKKEIQDYALNTMVYKMK